MREDQGWLAFLGPRFSVLELDCRRSRPLVQYVDVVTGWRGTSPSSGFERPRRRLMK